MKKTLEQNDALKLAYVALKDLEQAFEEKFTKKGWPLQYEALKSVQQAIVDTIMESPMERFVR